MINESPYTQDGQTVVRNFFLYQWMGGSTWAYTGKYTADYTRVGEASISNAGSLLSPISTTWFNDTGYSQFADTALPIPDSGLYFSNGFQVYAVGMQLRRYSMRTGQIVKQYWNPRMWNLLGFDLHYNYDFQSYCDFRVLQPG